MADNGLGNGYPDFGLGGSMHAVDGRFTLHYLLEPSSRETPLMPPGTCLSLRNSGSDAVSGVLVDPNDPSLAPRSAARLDIGEQLGLCSLRDVEAYAATRMVFVDWVDRSGFASTTWLRLQPVPRGLMSLIRGTRGD